MTLAQAYMNEMLDFPLTMTCKYPTSSNIETSLLNQNLGDQPTSWRLRNLIKPHTKSWHSIIANLISESGPPCPNFDCDRHIANLNLESGPLTWIMIETRIKSS